MTDHHKCIDTINNLSKVVANVEQYRQQRDDAVTVAQHAEQELHDEKRAHQQTRSLTQAERAALVNIATNIEDIAGPEGINKIPAADARHILKQILTDANNGLEGKLPT